MLAFEGLTPKIKSGTFLIKISKEDYEGKSERKADASDDRERP